MSSQRIKNLLLQLGALTLGRLFLNIGLRMVYPFSSALTLGLDVSDGAISRLISLRSFAGLLGLLLSPLSERFGRRPVIALAMLLFSLGCLVIVLWPAYWLVGLGLSTIALAKVVYDPAMQAYLGDVVAYKNRGKALAITEFSWAGAFFIGIPAAGFLIAWQGWQAPFLVMGLFGLGAALLLWRTLPAADRLAGQATSLRTTWQVMRREPVIWAAAAYTFLVMTANEMLLIVYGRWMEDSFGLSLTGLGLATAVIGVAELSGELSTGLAVDRFGKRPVIILTGLLTALFYLVIPNTSATLVGALITLFTLFYFFEMTVVGGIPLMTEIVPQARGVALSMNVAASGLGRAAGAVAGFALWQAAGFQVLGLVSAGAMLLAALLLAWRVREGAGGHLSQSAEFEI
ncbi:MAG: MFS transporter [Chloroflexi bacterium]|nr:MFS transporter [Chloroflexota bacterium]MCI0580664.1 MFS transporter [Chloroflexota bacterium]MCI0648680.1 MFS transporter [Chloroflexota bacterium]MCI0728088.1 MFS transporter [Chloroflexota bacterium]